MPNGLLDPEPMVQSKSICLLDLLFGPVFAKAVAIGGHQVSLVVKQQLAVCVVPESVVVGRIVFLADFSLVLVVHFSSYRRKWSSPQKTG